MPDLHSVEPRRNEWLESVAPAGIARMRPKGESPRIVGDRDRILHRKSILGDESSSICAEVSEESFAKIADDPARDESARDVRPSERPAIALLEHFLEGERDAQRVEFPDDLLGARMAHLAEPDEMVLEALELRGVERKQMDFVISEERAELDTRDYANSNPLASFARG